MEDRIKDVMASVFEVSFDEINGDSSVHIALNRGVQ